MNDHRLSRGLAAVGAVAVGAGGLALVGAASPAAAFTGACPETTPASTLVADGVCEVRFTAAGAATFTPPSGIAKLSAVLVGGGAGANFYSFIGFASASGGDGGAVVYIDSVPLSADLAVTVGAGGLTGGAPFVDPLTYGGSTTLGDGVAAGGTHDRNVECDAAPGNADGGGARTDATGAAPCAPGVGFALAEIPGLDATLFPAASLTPEVYASGGSASGGGSVAPPQSRSVDGPVMVLAASTSPFAGTGGSVDAEGSATGAAGLVILRYAAPAAPPPAPPVPAAPTPSLAFSGGEVSWVAPSAAGAMVAIGALLVASVRRRTRISRRR